MRKASAMVIFVILATTGIYLLLPPRTEITFVYYRNHALSAQSTSPQPSPSSVFSQQGEERLSLEFIAQHKRYSINAPFSEVQSHTKVSLLLESQASELVSDPAQVKATIIDDLGQQYQFSRLLTVDLVAETQPSDRIWRYELLFPPLNPQAANVVITVDIDGALFELTGATLP